MVKMFKRGNNVCDGGNRWECQAFKFVNLIISNKPNTIHVFKVFCMTMYITGNTDTQLEVS